MTVGCFHVVYCMIREDVLVEFPTLEAGSTWSSSTYLASLQSMEEGRLTTPTFESWSLDSYA
jgi:hypothetical protein